MPIGLEANPYFELTDAVRETSRSTMIIDLSAIESNYRKCQALAPRSACGAVVKADAYGLGATRIAPFLASLGCAHFFVADVEEGIALRDVLPLSARIYMLYGVRPGMESAAEQHNLLPILNSREQLEAWLRHCRLRNRALPAGVHVDTGLSRLGFSTDELHTIAENRSGLSEFPVVLLMSQLACAEWRNEICLQQLNRFRRLSHLFPNAVLSLSNSAGLFAGREFHFDLVRSGGGIFGFAASDDPDFKPMQVVHLRTQIIQCRKVEHGEAIGYFRSYTVKKRMRVATAAIGYADGFPRNLGNRGHVFIHGRRALIVGFVSMDLITIDVTDLPESWTPAGTVVDLICPEQTVADMASAAKMLSDELTTAMGRRCRRLYVSSARDDMRHR
ncbi:MULTISPECIES: alanine racemase [Bradyrhizobium]|uniref:Alanine racemase n=1 Tax=Bradyrhizobium elkanii TaxID=29448 RepID=A0A4U6RAG3_BRAEL|nr:MULTISPECIES: alanine racemase [Bradyrhizobium]MTV12017.1 alanine racemase [Bradyrhizobium sp. BR2003]TKV70907.1 alanine racemase [Bradyrhizobium elkanii]